MNKSRRVSDQIPAAKPSNTDEEIRTELISRVLATGDITREHLHTDDLVLNSVQLINFVQFYFDEPAQPPWCHVEAGSIHEKQSISVCFPCIACSYKFSFEHTFHQHLDRRSFIIRLNCLKCETFKTFFNKCKLFYHIYSHKQHILEPIFKSIQIESMPIEKMSQFMFGSADSHVKPVNNQYLDLEMLFLNFDTFCNEWEASSASHALTLAAFSMSNRILNNRFKIHEIDIQELRVFIRKLLTNKYLIYKCGVCDALFFDARDLRTHFAKSQANELAGTVPADILNTLVRCPENLTAYEEQLISNQKKLHLKSLMGKHTAFEASAYVRNNEMMNTVAFKRLQYTTRCYTLALMNTFTSTFKLFRNSNPQSNHDDEPAPTQPLVCPECGLSFESKTREGHVRFRHHLVYECFFTLKHQISELRCAVPGCSFSTDTEQQIVAHWSQSHLVKRIECNLCAVQNRLRYAFDDVGNHVVLAKNRLAAVSGPVKSQTILKHIVNIREHQCNRATSNEDRLINEALIAHVNQHQSEAHPGQPVELKLIYKCLCKRSDKTPENGRVDNCNEDELELDECAYDEWKTCRLHILALSSQPLCSIKCPKCQLVISQKDPKNVISEYNIHMNMHRDADNESFFLCPICGMVTKDKQLTEHVIKNHLQLNLNRHPTNCFFNLVTTLLDLSADKFADKSQLQPNNQFSFKYLTERFPKDYFIYFCLNCRLFYSSASTFSHNCWSMSANEKPAASNNGENKQNGARPPPTSSSTTNNYFSPIYLKFNVPQLLDKAGRTNEPEFRPTSSLNSTNRTPSFINNTANIIDPSPAFSSKRMRVDSIIEKLKP